jgi:hypothetical protein
MRIEKFQRDSPESLIIVKCLIPHHTFSLALDTGASHTTVDLTALLIAGFELSNSLRTEQIETASGVVEAYVFNVPQFTALGITKTNLEVCAYDFFAHHVLVEFDGVLGLDFLSGHHICIDFKKAEIQIDAV